LIAKKLFNGITVITPMMKDQICSHFNINPHGVGVWTSGVSTALYDPRKFTSESVELKKQLGLSEKFVVFYQGVFSATRGLTETIKAVSILKPKHADIVLFLLGSGPAVPMLTSLAKKDDLQENVIIHGTVNPVEVPKFISMSDVCISPLPDHPYWRFQCPLKLLEYLAMEKTVIVSDIPAHRFVIKGKKCGIYIQTVEPTEIAKSIEYAYQNRKKLSGWGEAGRAIVENKYTWEKVAADLEDYLLSIAY
jgi:glycosyltransferase involved in cell wall biosynthesis